MKSSKEAIFEITQYPQPRGNHMITKDVVTIGHVDQKRMEIATIMANNANSGFYDAGYERRRQEAEAIKQIDVDWMFNQMELADETDMLRDIDRISWLTKDRRFRDLDDIDDWEYLERYFDNDDDRETILVKSKPRRGRPSKRQLHPVDPHNYRVWYKRHWKCWTESVYKTQRRRRDRAEVLDQLNDHGECTSVHAALPKDEKPELACRERSFSVCLLPGGRVMYTHVSDPVRQTFRRDARLNAPRHAFNYHPATPSSVRRSGR